MRLRHSLPAAALGAAALGATLCANPAHADTPLPLPTSLQPVEVNSSPGTITVRVPDLVEVQVSVPLPLPTALPLPLPSAIPLPLPSAIPLPLPSAVPLPTLPADPLPTLPADPLPTLSGDPSAVVPTRPARTSSSSSPQATPPPPNSASTEARAASRSAPAPSTPVPATVFRVGHHTSDGRTPDRARVAMAAGIDEPSRPPVRPASGPPALVLALASAPAGVGTGGADPPTSAAEAVPPSAPLGPGRTVTAVDRRAASRPVERGPPPPQQLLITHSRPRR
ncbi:hypothetical protein [Micromonospora sp. NPDC049204]|uniref:hypothetical protein n=1 Tax=Micromonospora sp. NPDC049204 TaxID=3154351 RepID=UPI0033F30C00